MRAGWLERGDGGFPTQIPRLDAAAAQRLLCDGEVLSTELIPWGSNYTFLATLSFTGEPEGFGIYKPRRGEAPLWDFPDGTLYRRERAAYLVSHALGWDFVPLTVIRDGPHGVGSMQLFVEMDGNPHRPTWTEAHRAQLGQVALFDLVTNNADRKAGHCLLGVDGRVWGIDHGLTFHTDPKLRTVLWELYNDPIPDPLLEDLRGLLNRANRAQLVASLGDLLSRSEVEGFFERVQSVVDAGQYPEVRAYRRRPWPFF